MRSLLVACVLALPRVAFPCDSGGPSDVFTLARTAPVIVSAVAGPDGELRVLTTLAGTAPKTVTLPATDCRPALKPGVVYVVFLTITSTKEYFPSGANEGAFALPDDGHARLVVEELVRRMRAATNDAAVEALLPEALASRVPRLVRDSLRKAAFDRGPASAELCRQVERVLASDADERMLGMTREAAQEAFVRRCGSR